MRARRFAIVSATIALAVVPALAASAAPGNASPEISSIHVGAPSPKSGAVEIHVTATDPEGESLSVRATTSSRGRVRVDGGTVTYTPTPSARHAAAREGAPPRERSAIIVVRVSDPQGGRVSKRVTVPISPANHDPSVRVIVGKADPADGSILVRIKATDADGDPLRYRVPSSTDRGIIRGRGPRAEARAAAPEYTYTPTAAARQAAGAPGATQDDRQDTFTVTVSDGYGGTVEVPVTVSVAPAG